MQRREAAAVFALRHEDAVSERQCLLAARTSAQAGSPVVGAFACPLHRLVEDRQGEGCKKLVSSMNISVKKAEKTGY